MAVIRPFKAVRPSEKVAHLVAAFLMMLSIARSCRACKRKSDQFLRVTRSEIEMKEKVDVYSSEVYQKAKENFDRLRQEAPS